VPYDLGGVAVLGFTALDTDGNPAAPGAITLTITQPDGTVVTPTPHLQSEVSTGIYEAYFLTAQPGRHTYRWLATGTPGPGVGVGGEAESFDVRASLARTVLSLDDLLQTLNLKATDTELLGRARGYNAAVTFILEKLCGPIVVQQVTERYLESGEAEIIMLGRVPVYQPATQPHPIISITPVLQYGVTYDLPLLTVDFATGTLRHIAGLPFWNGPYDITYTVGRPVIPENILLAARIIIRHLWAIERGGSGSNSLGQPSDDVTMLYGYAIPNRALEVLDGPGTRDPGGIA
jgi:hypothetical protein